MYSPRLEQEMVELPIHIFVLYIFIYVHIEKLCSSYLFKGREDNKTIILTRVRKVQLEYYPGL